MLLWFKYTVQMRGRPFDSEGGGGLALFGHKYSDLENAGINNLSSSGRRINNLTLTCQNWGGSANFSIFLEHQNFPS